MRDTCSLTDDAKYALLGPFAWWHLEILKEDNDGLELGGLTSEERHRIYKMMRLDVVMSAGGIAKVTGAFDGLLGGQGNVSVKKVGTS